MAAIELKQSAIQPSGDVLVKVMVPEEAQERPAVSIVLVIDVSGSMGQQAPAPADATSERRNTGLTVLDIVKHATKTVIQVLGPNDKLGVVAYSDTAEKAYELQLMTDDNKTKALEAVDGLCTRGSTNIWEGLNTALGMLEAGAGTGSSAVLLLTDGIPNQGPQGAALPKALGDYREKARGKLSGVVHTFGFGKQLESSALDGLASEGTGLYVYIPDAGFVGTTIVNVTANALVTIGRNAKITVKAPANCQIARAYGYKTCGKPSVELPIGALCLGQSRDVVIQLEGGSEEDRKQPLEVSLHYDSVTGAEDVTVCEKDDSMEVGPEKCRLQLVDTLHEILSILGNGDDETLLEAARLKAQVLNNNWDNVEGIDELKQDLTGQVSEAISKRDWFRAWGKHYLFSLRRAHLNQQCNNFKDPGVAKYGGVLFEKSRDEADSIFVALPPPVKHNAPGRTSMASSTPVDMSTYHNRYGG